MDLKIGKTGIEEALWEFSFSESAGSFPILKAVAWGQRETKYIYEKPKCIQLPMTSFKIMVELEVQLLGEGN